MGGKGALAMAVRFSLWLALATGSFALAIALSLPVAADDESEPNDVIGQADVLTPGTEVRGNASELDTDFWTFSPAGAGAFVIAGSTWTNCESFRFSYADGTALPNGTYGGHIYGTVSRSEPVYIQACADPDWTGPYWFTVEFTVDAPYIEGPEEVEPNDNTSQASPLTLAAGVRGRAPWMYGDVDYWVVTPNQTGWMRIESESAWFNLSASAASGPLAVIGPFPNSGYYTGTWWYVNVSSGTATYLRVSPSSFGENYAIYATTARSLAAFSEGPGEREGNDDPANATVISGCAPAACQVSGSLDARTDPLDFFAISGNRGDLVTLTLATEGYGGGQFYVTNLGAPWRYETGTNPSIDLQLLFNFTGDMHIVLAPITETSDYSITVRFVGHTAAFEDGVAELSEFDELFYGCCRPNISGMDFEPRSPPPLSEGFGVLFGPTICTTGGPSNPVAPVVVPAGTVLMSGGTPSAVRSYITTRQAQFAWGGLSPSTCLRASTNSSVGDLPSYYYAYSFEAVGMANASHVAVAREVSGNLTDCEACTLALWAITEGFGIAGARDRGADNDTILAAQQILDNAGVSVALNGEYLIEPQNPPQPGTGNNTNGTGPAPPDNSALLLGGGVAGAGAAGGAAAFVFYKRRRRAAAAGAGVPCSACGAPIIAGASICTNCGSEVVPR